MSTITLLASTLKASILLLDERSVSLKPEMRLFCHYRVL